jgi:hypothetical protein
VKRMNATNRAVQLLAAVVLLAALRSMLAGWYNSRTDAKALLESRCITCHSLSIVADGTKSPGESETTVPRMTSL